MSAVGNNSPKYVVLNEDGDRGVAMEDILAEFAGPEQGTVKGFLDKINTVVVDIYISESELFEAFYRNGGPDREDGLMCSSDQYAEEIIGKKPASVKGAKRVQTRSEWNRKYELLGEVADSIQRRFGWSSEDATRILVGQSCESRVSGSGFPKRPPVSSVEPEVTPACYGEDCLSELLVNDETPLEEIIDSLRDRGIREGYLSEDDQSLDDTTTALDEESKEELEIEWLTQEEDYEDYGDYEEESEGEWLTQ